MLTLTDTAASAVKTITDQSPDLDEAGLRIQGTGTPDAAFELAVVPVPEPTDAVVEADGARVFLARDTALVLDERTLDARVDGAGGVEFALTKPA
ncbi:MAG TPA: Fe-S cluster assembly protein HesB [Microbacterium sp.]|nr:Fe-S cluster assembly protein HesB [Microbacterium sp.]